MVPPGKDKHEARGMRDHGHVVCHTTGPAMCCRTFFPILLCVYVKCVPLISMGRGMYTLTCGVHAHTCIVYNGMYEGCVGWVCGVCVCMYVSVHVCMHLLSLLTVETMYRVCRVTVFFY